MDDMMPLKFSYNTTVDTSADFSPIYLVYGRQSRLPSEAMYGSYRVPEIVDIMQKLKWFKEILPRQK